MFTPPLGWYHTGVEYMPKYPNFERVWCVMNIMDHMLGTDDISSGCTVYDEHVVCVDF